jgi:hypothetical protein
MPKKERKKSGGERGDILPVFIKVPIGIDKIKILF